MQYVRNLKELNPHLMCILCGGYLIEATTLIECSHSFCKSCIVQYLETSFNCPVCDTEVHKTKPLANIRSDQTLQEIIYKLVPELYEKEKKSRRLHEISLAQQDNSSRAGKSSEPDLIHEDYGRILVTLRYFRGHKSKRIRNEKILSLFPTRYLCCPLNLPVRVLKKFILQKFDLPTFWDVQVWRADETLLDNLTLADVVRVYGIFRERKPLEVSFSVFPQEETVKPKPKTESQQSNSIKTDNFNEEANSPSTLAARNILTTTPDPSDEEDVSRKNNDNKQIENSTENMMDVDNGGSFTPVSSVGLQSPSLQSVIVSS